MASNGQATSQSPQKMQRARFDLVDGGVALAGADAMFGRVLGGGDADAVGGTGGGAFASS